MERLLDCKIGGRCGNCIWEIDTDNTLTIGPVPGTDGMLKETDDLYAPGEFAAWAWHPYRRMVRKVVVQSGVKATWSMDEAFKSMLHCTAFDVGNMDMENVWSMRDMFSGCIYASDFEGLEKWNVKSAADAGGMFRGCFSLRNISALKNWDTKNLSAATSMFDGCRSLADISALAGWDVSGLKFAACMFRGTAVKDLSPLAEWNMENMEYMTDMFADCRSLTTLQPIGRWKLDKVTNMDRMFSGCRQLSDADALKAWKLPAFRSCEEMFLNTEVCVNPFDDIVPMACPRTGEFIAWKVCGRGKGAKCRNVLVKLLIPEDAERSSAFGKKCRCSKAKVLGFYELNGKEIRYALSARSLYKKSFIYKRWATVSASNFNPDRFIECASGIHFFYKMEDAVEYVGG